MDHAEDEAEFPEFLCVCGRGALCFWAGGFFLVVVIGVLELGTVGDGLPR